MKVVEKPWGEEIWFADNDRYVAKFVYIVANKRLSLQYHKKKRKTLYLLDGHLLINLGNKEYEINSAETPDDERVIDIVPNTIHRLKALADTTLLEVSSPETEDIVRLEDDYDRLG